MRFKSISNRCTKYYKNKSMPPDITHDNSIERMSFKKKNEPQKFKCNRN